MAARAIVRAVIGELVSDDDEIRVLNTVIGQAGAFALMDRPIKRQKRAKMEGFVEKTVWSYTATQFKEHFRMLPSVFEKLCQELSSSLPTWRTVDLRNQILATIWLFATPESYRSVADRFNFSKGQLHGIVGSVCHALVGLRQSYIKWPSTAELQGISDEWNVYGFPGVVGAIDGTYIPVQGISGENRDSYICRKGFPAMHLQVVCDRRMVFRDVQTGYPGSVHDSRVFKNSDLKVHLESPSGKLPADFHILGDSAYPNTSYLLTPFRDNGHLSSKEKKYNKLHSKARVIVEHSIGLLKGKFRRLKYLAMGNYTEIPYVIFACCILHNFILLSNETDEDDIDLSDNEDEDNIIYELPANPDKRGDQKRRTISENL